MTRFHCLALYKQKQERLANSVGLAPTFTVLETVALLIELTAYMWWTISVPLRGLAQSASGLSAIETFHSPFRVCIVAYYKNVCQGG